MKRELKLYDLERNSPLRVELVNGEMDNATFHHLDGMYSYCTTSDGQVFHLSGGTPVKLADGRYEIE